MKQKNTPRELSEREIVTYLKKHSSLPAEDSHIVGSISSGGKTIVNKEDDPKSLFVKLLYNCPYIKKGKCQFTEPQQCCFSCEGNQKCFEGRWEDLEYKRCQKGFTRCCRYHQWREENG